MTQIAVSHKLEESSNISAELISDIKHQLQGEQPKMVLIYAHTNEYLKEITIVFKENFPTAVVFGCIVPSKFSANNESIGGASCFALAGDYKVHGGMGTNLTQDTPKAIDDAILLLPQSIPGYPYVTGFILYDALSEVGEEIVMIISSILGNTVPLVGGAASGIDKQGKYISSDISLNFKMAKDAIGLVLLYSKKPLGIAVDHGHETLTRSVKVTKADKNIVYELDKRPAWEVWKEISRDTAIEQGNNPDHLSNEDEITNYLMNYEGSLTAEVGQNKIRAILKLDTKTQALHFACDIPEGVMINTSWTTPDKTIDSACKAANLSKKNLQGENIAGALVFDCVCRKLLLKENFFKSVNCIHNELENTPIMGYEAHGEICLRPGDNFGFHNTSTVVVSFPK